MLRWIKFILYFGLVTGLALGSIAAYAEWDLNPQMEYTMNPQNLIFVFAVWFSIGFLPAFLMAIILNVLRRQKNKK